MVAAWKGTDTKKKKKKKKRDVPIKLPLEKCAE
jgi:hypothetical protein